MTFLKSPWASFLLGVGAAAAVGIAVRPPASRSASARPTNQEQTQGQTNAELAKLVRDEVHGAMALERRRLLAQMDRAGGEVPGAAPTEGGADEESEPESEQLTEARSWVKEASSTGRWTKEHGERLRESGALLTEAEKQRVLRDLMVAYNSRKIELEPGSFMPAVPGHN